MADPARSLDEIKKDLETAGLQPGQIQSALRDLCDHLIAQKAEIEANKAEIAQRPTMGQVVAMGRGGHL